MRVSIKPLRLFLGSIIVFLVVAALGVWQLGNWLSAPATQPVKADLIVALGGDNGERVMLAASLYQSGYANRILLTGMEGGADAVRMHYLNWRTQYLRDAGVPESAILFDGQSANTQQEAINTSVLLSRMGWKRALIVSDPPHMRRLHRTFDPVFADANLDYTLVATNAASWDAGTWWRDEKWAQFSLMEVVKLIYYSAKY